jgi:hypothetical protein
LGFAVLDISDTEDFMQTHPMVDRMTGARGFGILPSGLTRVAAEVATAHPQGPVAEYGLFVVERGLGGETPLAFEEALTSYLQGEPAPSSVRAFAKVVAPPGRRERIVIDLDEPLQEPMDLIFTVRTLSDHVSFAWCRWFFLETTIAIPPTPRHGFVVPAK